MEGLITFLLVLIAFDTSSISNKLGKINQNLTDIKQQIKKEGNNEKNIIEN